jgi:hypothetical protein
MTGERRTSLPPYLGEEDKLLKSLTSSETKVERRIYRTDKNVSYRKLLICTNKM